MTCSAAGLLSPVPKEPSPDLTGYGLAITTCGYAGDVEACIGLLGEMLRGGMTPTLADYHSSLRACAMRRRCVTMIHAAPSA